MSTCLNTREVGRPTSGQSRGLRPIVFAGLGDGFNEYPGRQLLLHALSKYTPVYFLKWRSAAESAWSPPRIVERASNIFEIQRAFSLRNSRLRRAGPFIGRIDACQLTGALRRAGVADFIYWVSVADARLLWSMPLTNLVYDCVDPCFVPEKQIEFDAAERVVSRQAKLVFCTAQSLYERVGAWNANCVLLPNACASSDIPTDTERLRKDVTIILGTHSGPTVGYMGTVDWRFDVSCMHAIATSLKDFRFVIVGRVNADQEDRVRCLRALPNVMFTGSVTRELGIAYTAAFDVALIPFIPGPMNDAINPVKMYMYLAAGKPIVSTDLRECRLNTRFVAVGRSAAEMAALIADAARNDSDARRKPRTEFGLENRWEARALEALQYLQKLG